MEQKKRGRKPGTPKTGGRKKGTPKTGGKKPGALKTGGRKKGARNKVTLPLREFITGFLTENQATIKSDFKKLSPYQRIQLFERLTKYALPMLQSIEATVDVNKLSDEQLALMIHQIKNNLSS